MESVEYTLGSSTRELASYLSLTRRRRHEVEYEVTGTIGKEDVEELVGKVELLEKEVLTWLRKKHPHLVPPGDA
ncbi:MAG: hypothetical protein HYY17_01420 [Planctomycetes bacterium]|nr:hypothetical protein [Planctomycetota bacterium]